MKYTEQKNKEYLLKINQILKELPDYCRMFIEGRSNVLAVRTQLGYLVDLQVFFFYLSTNNPIAAKYKIKDIPIDIIENLKATDINEFLFYLQVYEKDGITYTNSRAGVKRKLSTLKSFFKFLYNNDYITSNVTSKVEVPKLPNKEITRLESYEVENLKSTVEVGKFGMSYMQKAYHEKNKLRDYALITLLLGTGLRVSECVGIDIQDFNFNENRVTVTRKGGDVKSVYFNDETKEAVYRYYLYRKEITGLDEAHKNAFFLSGQNKRLSVRSVQTIVKKYSALADSSKIISPHKLRSTYGTELYENTNDIYLVSEALNHKSLNTAQRSYVEMSSQRVKKIMDIDMYSRNDKE